MIPLITTTSSPGSLPYGVGTDGSIFFTCFRLNMNTSPMAISCHSESHGVFPEGIQDEDRAFREMGRILATGGLLAFSGERSPSNTSEHCRFVCPSVLTAARQPSSS